MYKACNLDKRICDTVSDASNTQTLREWIHDVYRYIYNTDISDVVINKMSDQVLTEFVEELDWLSWK